MNADIVSLLMQACMTSRALNNAVSYSIQAYMTSHDSNKADCNSSQACMTSSRPHDKLCSQLSDIEASSSQEQGLVWHTPSLSLFIRGDEAR